MSESQTFQRVSEATLEEHREINFYLDQMTRTLEGLRDGVVDVEPIRRLAAQIQGLRERLLQHYRAEEQDGLFQAILAVMPDCRVEVSRLVNQHERILDILEMASIHAQKGTPGEVSELRDDLQTFIDMFRGHERDEEHLLRRALERERTEAD